MPVTASPAIPVPVGHACAPKAARFCQPQDRDRRTGEQRGCTSGNPHPPKTVRPISINRQSSTRPITSPKNGLSRWSRQRRTTLTAPDTINGPGALILIIPDFASVRISVAASAALPGRFVPARAESRIATECSRAGSRCVATPWRSAQADGGRSEGARSGLRARAISSRDSTRAGRCSAARPAFGSVGRGRNAGRPYLGSGANCGPLAGFIPVPMRVTYAIQTLPARAKENSVPLIKNATAFL